MDRSQELENAVKNVMQSWVEWLANDEDVRTFVIADEKQKRYLLMSEGWDGYKRVHDTLFDLSVRDGKIWVHVCNVDKPIDRELYEEGVLPKEIKVVLHPSMEKVLAS